MNQTNTNQVGDLPQGLAVASMVAGILSLLGCSVFAAIPAIVCGHIGVRQADRGEASGKGMAMAGLIMGYISLAVTLIIVAIYVVFFILLATAGVAAVSMANELLGDSVIFAVENDPAIVEHIGDIESCSLVLGETAKAAEAAEQPGDSTPLVFQIEGSKGKATLLMTPRPGSSNAFSSGTLVLDSGKSIPLQPLEQSPFDMEGLDLDDEFDLDDLIDEGDTSSLDIEAGRGVAIAGL